MDIVPKTGFKGLIENWQSDLIAALSVSLVALPLALGIAMASNVSPVAGIFSAIIGGVVTTFFRGSHIAINGPAAGLIAVILGSIVALDDGSGNALNYVLAAIVVSGALQVLLGLLKMGRFADIFHSTVIHGILAAIGVIIFSKQIHVALGTTPDSGDVIGSLLEVFHKIPEINPVVALISFTSLLLLIFHSRISYKLFHFFPAPMWVLILAIPFVYAFNLFDPHILNIFGNDYQLGPELLINIPDNVLDAIAYPNFSRIDSFPFWTSVLSITMIASIESLASSKAVDKLDPYKRRTDLNKDLIGIGLSTMVSGALGGLPIITVIVRSTVNVHNNAKTKWSNLYHGILLVFFIFLLTPLIQMIPLATLAILLVFTGYKLASPTIFKHVYDQGIEQLVFFVGTLVITLLTDILIGVFGGLLLALVVHMLMAKVSIKTFFMMIYRSGSNLFIKKDGSYELKIKGIANFLSVLNIENLISQIPGQTKVNIDLSAARLVDFTILENLYDFQRIHENNGGKVDIRGLDKHTSSSWHKLAMKIQTKPLHQLTNREIRLQEIAVEYGWEFQNDPDNPVDYFETFYFFKTRPVEKKLNSIFVQNENDNLEIADITFEEGAFMYSDEYDTTLGIIKFPFPIPIFTIEKKASIEKFLDISAHRDIDYELFYHFSPKHTVKVKDIEELDSFLNEELLALINEHDIRHFESNGEAILIFTNNLRLARIQEYAKFIKLTTELTALIKKSHNG